MTGTHNAATENQALLRSLLEGSIDPCALLDNHGHIIYANAAMRTMIGLRGKSSQTTKKKFLELIKIKDDRVIAFFKMAEDSPMERRYDEVPAELKSEKIRVCFKARVLKVSRNSPALGILVTLRDTTGEVLLQAKYHKSLEMLQMKDDKILALEEKITLLQRTLRHASGRPY